MPVRKGQRRGPILYDRPSRKGALMGEGNGNGRGKALRLADARARTPPVDPGEALRLDMRSAFLRSVGAAGAEELAAKLKEQALAGDHRAMQMLVNLLTAPPAPPKVVVVKAAKKRRKKVEVVAGRQDRPPVKETLREDCAAFLKLEGPLTAEALGERVGATAYVVGAMMAEDSWFEEAAGGRWTLSGEGFAGVNKGRDD